MSEAAAIPAPPRTGMTAEAEPVNRKIQPYPGCPDFAWIVADRVTDPYMDLDCIILITGRKRIGKSTLGIALAEDIADDIALMNGEDDPKKYFSIDTNVISVNRMGGLELLTSPRASQRNQVFVLDDAKINLSNRRFGSQENQLQNDIATICGPFRHVLIYTMVFKKTIDVGTRELADFIIQVEHTNSFTKQSVGKVFFYETSGDGHEYKKYLRWVDPETGIKYRIRDWIGTLPSHEALLAYNNLRRSGSLQLIEEARLKYNDMMKSKSEVRLSKKELRDIWVRKNQVEVQSRKAKGLAMRKMSRDFSVPVTWIERCLMKEIEYGPE